MIFRFHQIKLYSIKMIRSSTNFKIYCEWFWWVCEISCSGGTGVPAMLECVASFSWFQSTPSTSTASNKRKTKCICISFIFYFSFNFAPQLCVHHFYLFIYSYFFSLSCQSGILFTQISIHMFCMCVRLFVSVQVCARVLFFIIMFINGKRWIFM